MHDAQAELILRVARLERRLRIATVVAACSLVSGLLAVTGAAGSPTSAATPAPAPSPVRGVLTVRELNVVDGNGVTRVKLAAPLPNAVVDGRHLTRGGRPRDTLSGMLLFDAQGVERSGYATADRGYSNVLLTLDDKHEQHALLIAEPTGATTLRLFNAATRDRLDLAVGEDGPSIAMVRRGKEVQRFPAD